MDSKNSKTMWFATITQLEEDLSLSCVLKMLLCGILYTNVLKIIS